MGCLTHLEGPTPPRGGVQTRLTRPPMAGCESCGKGKEGTPACARTAAAGSHAGSQRLLSYSNLAGEEKGLAASTTNMTSWSRSVVPALKTSIAVSGPCPFMDWPALA